MSARVDWWEGARIAIYSLRANRLRAVLTILSIGIGVSTLLAIVGMIQGLNDSFEKQLASMGASSLYVSKMPWADFGAWWQYRNRKDLTWATVEAIEQHSTFAKAVAPQLRRSADVSFMGGTLAQISIIGTTASYLSVSGFELAQGRFLVESEDDLRQPVVILGMDLAETLFPLSEPIGSTVLIAQRPFRVVGVFARKGKLLEESQDLVAVIPYQSFLSNWGQQRGLTIGILVENPEMLDACEEELVGILRRQRGTPPEKPDDFSINRTEQLASTYQQLTQALYGVALGIGFITLLVGGIGIMNIMLVSVRERTREIGIRRALGARRKTIVLQFMMEATFLSALGGLGGTVVGLGSAKVLSWVTPLAAAVEPFTVIFGVGFSAFVGLLFGIWPAARAASLDPVEALRNE